MKEFENTIVSNTSIEKVLPSEPLNGDRNPGIPALAEFRTETSSDRRIPFSGFLTNNLLAGLPGPDFARLLPHLEPVSLFAGREVYGLGDFATHAYFPETAVITHLYLLADGSTTSAAIIGRDGMIGLSAILESSPQSYATQIAITGDALRIELEALKEEFARGRALQQILLSYTSCRLAQLSQKAVCNGRHKLDERLCTWLLMVHDRADQDRLPLSKHIEQTNQVANHVKKRVSGDVSRLIGLAIAA